MTKTITFALALFFTLPCLADDEAPDPSSRGGILASEVHTSPVVGPEEMTREIAIHKTSHKPACPSGWTLTCSDEDDDNCNCLP
jgi:hypothetical protein